MNQPANRRHLIREGLRFTLPALAFVVAAGPARGETVNVTCSKGETIAKALTIAQPGDTIRVTGTCKERFTITKDRISLEGKGKAAIDGDGGGSAPIDQSGVITIDGARGVRVSGLTIFNGPGEGVFATRGASFVLRDVVLEGNKGAGLGVDGSMAELRDATMRQNLGGMDVYGASGVVLRGNIATTNNRTNGININVQSVMEVRGAKVVADDNANFGLVVTGARVALFDSAATKGSSLSADRNGIGGIVVTTGSFEIYGSAGLFELSAAYNGVWGINVAVDGWLISPFAAGVFNVHHNPTGMTFGTGSGALINGGLRVHYNGDFGILADGANALTLGSDAANPSTVTGNGKDVSLAFGTRATFDGVSVGSISCDATALTRGSTKCPAAAR